MDTAEFAVERMDKLLARLAYQAGRTVRSPDPDAVHDLRVAIRRFAQALSVFGQADQNKQRKRLRRQLKHLLEPAGNIRNCDIALEMSAKWKQSQARPLRAEFRTRRKAEVTVFLEELRRWVERRSSSKWRESLGLRGPRSSPPTGPVEETARRVLAGMVREFFARGDRAALDRVSGKELHKFRICAKRFRYTLEVFAPLYGNRAEDLLAQVRSLQSVLGRANDYRTVRLMISELGGVPRLEAGLKGAQRRKVKEFQRLWSEGFAGSGTARGWLARLEQTTQEPAPTRKPALRAAGASSFVKAATSAG